MVDHVSERCLDTCRELLVLDGTRHLLSTTNQLTVVACDIGLSDDGMFMVRPVSS